MSGRPMKVLPHLYLELHVRLYQPAVARVVSVDVALYVLVSILESYMIVGVISFDLSRLTGVGKIRSSPFPC